MRPPVRQKLFLWDRDNVVHFIGAYQQALQDLKRLIQSGDAAGIEKALERAQDERDKLNPRSAVSA